MHQDEKASGHRNAQNVQPGFMEAGKMTFVMLSRAHCDFISHYSYKYPTKDLPKWTKL